MFFKILNDLPPLPQHLIDKVDPTFIPPDDIVDYTVARNLQNWNGYQGKAAQNRSVIADQEFIDWVATNITTDFQKVKLNYVDCSEGKLHTGAHTDGTRLWTLLWNIRTGGNNAELCFYQEHGQPLERELKLQKEDRSCLTVVDTIVGPANCWYLINSLILHGTENITEPRINLQIGFTTLPSLLQ